MGRGGLFCPHNTRFPAVPLSHDMVTPRAPWLRSTSTWRTEKIWPPLVVQRRLGEDKDSSALLPVLAARISPGKLLLVPFMGSKEMFPGPGEDIHGHSGVGSHGRWPDKWIWDTRGLRLIPCCWDQQEVGPHFPPFPGGHRSSVIRETVTFTACKPSAFPHGHAACLGDSATH